MLFGLTDERGDAGGDFHRLTDAEIAEVLDISEQTIRLREADGRTHDSATICAVVTFSCMLTVPGGGVVTAGIVHGMDAVDVGPHPGVDVADQGAVVPAIPQGANGRGKVRRHLVSQIA